MGKICKICKSKGIDMEVPSRARARIYKGIWWRKAKP